LVNWNTFSSDVVEIFMKIEARFFWSLFISEVSMSAITYGRLATGLFVGELC
jgi:hypothetical protein